MIKNRNSKSLKILVQNLEALILSAACLLIILGGSQPGWADQADAPHVAHLTATRGPKLIDCTTCHIDPDNTGINYDACLPCHSPDGIFDGLNDPDIGAISNWGNSETGSRIYESDGRLKPGKEKWCVGCHDDGRCVVEGVPAPNIAGLSVIGDWQSPEAITYADNPSTAYLMIDGDPNTGSIQGETILDLGESNSGRIGYVRIYSEGVSNKWILYGSNDYTDPDSWIRIVYGQSIIWSAPVWETGLELKEGWNEIRMDRFIPLRYIKLSKISPWPVPADCIREFEYNKELHYGYYISGHKLSCTKCHDTAGSHIDGLAQTYRAVLNNHQTGYRLKMVEVAGETVSPLEIPRVGCNSDPRSSHDFALCFTCHDQYKLLGAADGPGNFYQVPLQTNFRNVDDLGLEVNAHLIHLRGRGYCGNTWDWDSDWDCQFPVSDNIFAVTSGDWKTYAESDKSYGANYLIANGVNGSELEPTAVCRWEPYLPSAAIYKVYGRWADMADSAQDALYTISFNGGTQTEMVMVDQTTNPGQWNLLGEYLFSGSHNEYIELTNKANGKVCADAIKLEQSGVITTMDSVIVDNFEAVTNSTWNLSSLILGYYGPDYLEATVVLGTPTVDCRWIPQLGYGGAYQVYAWWPAASYLATDAAYTISFKGGLETSTVLMNQTKNGGRWMLLGTFEFRATGNEYVSLSNLSSYSNVSVVADAVKLVKVSSAKFPPDSPMSCTACHNVHGSISPAMNRHGELASLPGTLDKAPMYNLQYLDENGQLAPDLTKVMASIGGQTQFYGAGPGGFLKNFTCNMCHNDKITYYRSPIPSPVNNCNSCHLGVIEGQPSHVAHLMSSPMGPKIDCRDCHGSAEVSPHLGLFADAKSFNETTACDPCHSPGGEYNGVNSVNGSVGAKDNWLTGVYSGGDLKPGKEKWCIGCHDNAPADSKKDGTGVKAPNKAGDGSTYGYYRTGHGTTSLYKTTLHGQPGPGYSCTVCHEIGATHLSHALGDTDRLKPVEDLFDYTKEASQVCLDCHKVGQSDLGLLGYDAKSEATVHSGGVTGNYDTPLEAPLAFPAYGNSADYNTEPGYQCESCHDLHGTSKLAMVRGIIDGRLGNVSHPITITGFEITDSDLTDLDPTTAPTDGVCDACHKLSDQTGAHPDTRQDGNHQQGRTGSSCVKCHPHSANFLAGGIGGNSCVQCHAEPFEYTRQITGEGGDFVQPSHHVSDGTSTQIVTDQDCKACHDQTHHTEGIVWLRNTNNGTSSAYDSNNPFTAEAHCLSCHDNMDLPFSPFSPFSDGKIAPNVQNGLLWSNSAHAGGSGAQKRVSCMGDGLLTGCHDNGHASANAPLLAPQAVPGPGEEAFCYSCHNGQMVAKNIKVPFEKTYRHPVERAGLHQAKESGSDLGLTNRHAECLDCHNPHAAGTKVHIATGTANGNFIMENNVLKGAWGVEPIATTDLVPGRQIYKFQELKPPLFPEGCTKEYQLCFKCHSYYALGYATNGVTTIVGPSGDKITDQAMEFSSANRSVHPVVKTLADQPGSYSPKGLAAVQMKAPWNLNLGHQTMYCSDCHGSEAANTLEAQGPHGSGKKFMLKDTSGGGKVYWPTRPDGEVWTLYDLKANRNDWKNKLFCAACHVLYNGKFLNKVHDKGDHNDDDYYVQGKRYNGAPCVMCHTAVPHGAAASRLIAYRSDLAPYNYGQATGQKGFAVIAGFKKTSRDNYDEENCYIPNPETTGWGCEDHEDLALSYDLKASNPLPPINQPPVAQAGTDQTVGLSQAVLFSGSSSYDPDGAMASYQWNFGDGQTATGLTVTHVYSALGTYTLTLTVTDTEGAGAIDTATITVIIPPPNQPPVAKAGPDQTGYLNQAVSFSGAGSSDADGTITSYGWDFGDGATATGLTIAHVYTSEGTYQVTLTVTDNSGDQSQDTAIVTITGVSPILACADEVLQINDLRYRTSSDNTGDGLINITSKFCDGSNYSTYRVENNYEGHQVISMRLNSESAPYPQVLLKVYVTRLADGRTQTLRVYSYTSDHNVVDSSSYKDFSITQQSAWATLDVTTLARKMDGKGRVKFRLTCTSDRYLELSEGKFELK